MKIVVIHGENTNDSLKRLIYIESVAKIKKWQIVKINKNTKIKEYKLQNTIFKFLESFYPSSKTCINYLYQVIEKEPIEFVFLLLARQLKDLYLVKMEPSSIPYASWRVKKLEFQAY